MVDKGLKKISMIFTCTFDGGISYDDDIICDHPHILQKFHNITNACDVPDKLNAVIMGRRTWELIGMPLKDRVNIVISKNRQLYTAYDNVIVVNSIIGAITYCNYDRCIDKIFVIGGASIIEGFLCNRMYDKIIDKIYLSIPFCDDTLKADKMIPMNVIYAHYNIMKDLGYERYANDREYASYVCVPKM